MVSFANIWTGKFFQKDVGVAFSSDQGVFAGRHPRTSLGLHASEASPEVHQEQATEGAGRSGHLQRWQVLDTERSV